MDAISLDTDLGTQIWGHRISSIEGPKEDRKPADSADSIEKLSY